MTLYSSRDYRNRFNTDYRYSFNIDNIDKFNRAMNFDHTASMFKDDHRANENFIKSNVIMLDFDENALSINEFVNKHKDIDFYLATSKSHNKEKDGKKAQPRYHIYCEIPLTDNSKHYSLLIKSAQIYFETADTACKDVSRFFNGNRDKERKVLYNKGKSIIHNIQDIYNQLEKKQEKELVKNEIKKCYNNHIAHNNNYECYINKVLANEDYSKGNRNNVLTQLAGLCKKNNFPVDALYYANEFIGLEDKEFNGIIKLFNKE